ncbi:MAG: murein L,D-transpeptidase catalytic domain family protein [Chlorobiaceae bacterium]|nr:murein L,D-transpeptidase catalytic domain family protein [Chlorobiaceae bacterium]NTW10015.1 murein L,D-transpeptidase catalytic domain family protein [Chlorobiaceae bacterium]
MNRWITTLFAVITFAFPLQGSAMSFEEQLLHTDFSPVSRFTDLKGQISPELLKMAMSGYRTLKEQGKVVRDGILTIIDFNKPSFSDRLFVIDVNNGHILYAGLVAHGSGSGEVFAENFSNNPGSHRSSLGFYTTGDTYDGKHGYSLRLFGMEPGINDKAESRSIVIHGADYVSHDYVRIHGRIGRSQGCPAVSFDNFQEIIDLIKGGSCLFIYHGDRSYAFKSSIINPGLARMPSGIDPFS